MLHISGAGQEGSLLLALVRIFAQLQVVTSSKATSERVGPLVALWPGFESVGSPVALWVGSNPDHDRYDDANTATREVDRSQSQQKVWREQPPERYIPVTVGRSSLL